ASLYVLSRRRRTPEKQILIDPYLPNEYNLRMVKLHTASMYCYLQQIVRRSMRGETYGCPIQRFLSSSCYCSRFTYNYINLSKSFLDVKYDWLGYFLLALETHYAIA
ncbi:hypothetical protein S245_067281, partial [Arachis hypogaea]